MKNPIVRRSFLHRIGLGSLGAMAAGSFLHGAAAAEPREEKPDKKKSGESGVKTFDNRLQKSPAVFFRA